MLTNQSLGNHCKNKIGPICEDNYSEYIAIVEQLLDSGSADELVAMIPLFEEYGVEDGYLQFVFGNAYVVKGEFKKAAERYAKAIEYDYDDEGVLGAFAIIECMMGNTEVSIETLKKINRESAYYVPVQVAICRILINEGRYIEAEKYFEENKTFLNENSVSYHFMALEIYGRLHDLSKMKESLEWFSNRADIDAISFFMALVDYSENKYEDSYHRLSRIVEKQDKTMFFYYALFLIGVLMIEKPKLTEYRFTIDEIKRTLEEEITQEHYYLLYLLKTLNEMSGDSKGINMCEEILSQNEVLSELWNEVQFEHEEYIDGTVF